MNIMQQPFFLNAGGNKNTKPGLYLWYDMENPLIENISTSGQIIVHSTVNGEQHTETYSDLSDAVLTIQADPNTQVRIEGDITTITFRSEKRIIAIGDVRVDVALCNALTRADLCDLSGAKLAQFQAQGVITPVTFKLNDKVSAVAILLMPIDALLNDAKHAKEIIIKSGFSYHDALDLSQYKELISLNINYLDITSLVLPNNIQSLDLNETLMRSIDLSNCTELTSVKIGGNYVKSIDISKNEKLTSLTGSKDSYKLPNIDTIYTRANNENVAGSVVNIIKNSTKEDGILYLNSKDTYVLEIEMEARSKGWTVQPLE